VLDVTDDGHELVVAVESTVTVVGLFGVWDAREGEGPPVGEPARHANG
jgi:hypothetical protein